MPAVAPVLTLDQVRDRLERASAAPTAGVRQVGIETEWHVVHRGDGTRPVALEDLRRIATGPLPGGSAITFEPGGQIELSSRPGAGIGTVVAALSADIDAVRRRLADHGLELVGSGVDAHRSPHRQLDAPRYAAMEAYFDADGPHGRVMMTRTASVQVNLDNGSAGEIERRWRHVHALGPVLVAAFANSPLACGRPTGWRSTRLANWWSIDRSRTAPVDHDRPLGAAWTDYALDARVMLIRAGTGAGAGAEPVLDGMRLRDWIAHGHRLGHPTFGDVDYHLTTLFPPVRPRGWFELRYLDAVPMPWWPVVAAVTAVLVDDEAAAATAGEAARATAGAWMVAARHGLTDDRLAVAAERCFDAALAALDRLGTERPLRDRCAAYADHFVRRRRTPADDVLDHGEPTLR